MTAATKFFEVQKALGFEDRSMVSSTNFEELDGKYKTESRLLDKQVELANGMVVRGIFVDNALVLCIADGQIVETDENKLRSILNV